MNRPTASSVGEKIAIARRRRGMARRALADLIGRSEEWLRQIENGQRNLTNLESVLRLAEVLDLRSLLPTLGMGSGEAIYVDDDSMWLPIRRALLDSAALTAFPAQPPDPARAARTLETAVSHAWDVWLRKGDDRYTRTTKALPELLHAAAIYLHDEAHLLAPEPALDAYHLASTVLARTGQEHLVWLPTDRAFRVAEQVGGSALLAAAWYLAASYLRQGFLLEAEWLAMAAISGVTASPVTDELNILHGALYLLAGEAAAGTLEGPRAEHLLAQAHKMAASMDGDKAVRRIVFGPAEEGLSRMEVAVRQGRGGEALRLAAQFEMPDDHPVDRRVKYYAHLAYLHARRNEDAAAVFALGKVAALSPEDLKYNTRLRSALQRLLHRNNRTVQRELNQFSDLAGMS